MMRLQPVTNENYQYQVDHEAVELHRYRDPRRVYKFRLRMTLLHYTLSVWIASSMLVPIRVLAYLPTSRIKFENGEQLRWDRKPTFLRSSIGERLPGTLPVEVVNSMPEPLPGNLKNDYYLLRHGQSLANVDGIISSARTLAYTEKHGLTPTGVDQGRASAVDLLDLLESSPNKRQDLLLISSPFARARQTAQACLEGLDAQSDRLQALGLSVPSHVILNDLLVERYFGRLDDTQIYTYAYVWPLDNFDTLNTAFGVESVAAVCTRLRQLVMELEQKYENAHVVWVSHADVLQIAQLYAAGVENVGMFSCYRFKNGEVRRMVLNQPSSLPPPNPLDAPWLGTKLIK